MPGAGAAILMASFTLASAADDVEVAAEVSSDLMHWTPPERATSPCLPFRRGDGVGALTTWTSGPLAFPGSAQQFLRLRVSLR